MFSDSGDDKPWRRRWTFSEVIFMFSDSGDDKQTVNEEVNELTEQ